MNGFSKCGMMPYINLYENDQNKLKRKLNAEISFSRVKPKPKNVFLSRGHYEKHREKQRHFQVMNKAPAFFSKKNFWKWIDKQPNERAFDFFDNHKCAIASFITEKTGEKEPAFCYQKFHLKREIYATPKWAANLDYRFGRMENTFTIADIKKLPKSLRR
jgi:hypothetical protein